jgi:hypothetical protein
MFKLYQESLEMLQHYEQRFGELLAARNPNTGATVEMEGKGDIATESGAEEELTQASTVLHYDVQAVPATMAPEFDLFDVSPSLAMDKEADDMDEERTVVDVAEANSTTLVTLLTRQNPLRQVIELESTPIKCSIQGREIAASPDLLIARATQSPVNAVAETVASSGQAQGNGSGRRSPVEIDSAQLKRHKAEGMSEQLEDPRTQDLLSPNQESTQDLLASPLRQEPEGDPAIQAEASSETTPIKTQEISKQEDNKTPSVRPFQNVVRDKSARAALPGACCEECRAFYTNLARDLHPNEDIQKVMDRYSRHRHQFQAPPTPQGYWDMWSLPPDESEPSPRVRLAPLGLFRPRNPQQTST